MARRRPPEDPGSHEPPVDPWSHERPVRDVRPTVVRDRGLRRFRTAGLTIVVVALAVVAIVYGGVLQRSSSRRVTVVRASIGPDVLIGPDALAAAFREALRCQTLTFAVGDPQYFRAQPNHTGACRQYSPGHAVIYREVRREFRAVLDAADYVCPVSALPTIVQKELRLCPADG
jgi:hypothetical protein